MPVVICNTSPIQYLYQADVLELLPALAGQVYVPEAVVAELKEGRQSAAFSTRFSPFWIVSNHCSSD